MGRTIGAASFLQILAPELNYRMLADFLEMDSNITVNFHIRNSERGIGHFRHFLDLKVEKAERVIVKAVVDIIKDEMCIRDRPEIIPASSMQQLSNDGISFIKKSSTKLCHHIIEINRLISDRINNCKSPVSYTHIDVYKRQEFYPKNCHCKVVL